MNTDHSGALMYGGTEGSSGSDASHERAEREAREGIASERQEAILAELGRRGERGATWSMIARALDLHHGQATGALSNLHKAGLVARLQERVGRSSLYVLPEHVNGRQTAAQGRRGDTSPVGFPYRHDGWFVLGPDVRATLDGEGIVWQGRRYHPVDSHDARRGEEPAGTGRRPLF